MADEGLSLDDPRVPPAVRAAAIASIRGGAYPGGAETGGEIKAPGFWERTAVRAGDIGKKLSSGIGEGTYELMPHTWTDAMTLALSMLLPEAKGIGKAAEEFGVPAVRSIGEVIGKRGFLPGMARLGATGAATGATSKAEGGDFGTGALQGAGAYALGSVPAKITDIIDRWHMGGLLRRRDPARVGKIINEMVPELPAMRTAEDIRNVFVTKAGGKAVSDTMEDGFRAINSLPNMRGKRLNVPQFAASVNAVTGGNVPSQLTAREIGAYWPEAMASSGYGAAGQALHSVSGAASRYRHEALVKEVSEELAKYNPEGPKALATALTRYSRGRRMVDFMKTPGVLKDGEINMPMLQKLWGVEKKGGRLEGAFQPQEVAQFWQSIFRGGKPGVADIPPVRAEPSVRMGIFGPHVHGRFPKPGLYAGDPRTALAAILQGIGRGGAAEGVNYVARPEEALPAH